MSSQAAVAGVRRRRRLELVPAATSEHVRERTAEELEQFERLYLRMFGRLCDFAAQWLTPDDAKDVTQVVMVRMWENWERVSAVRHVEAYLHAAVYHDVVNFRRDRRTRRTLIGRFMRESVAPALRPQEDDLEHKNLAEVVDAAVGQLPDLSRAAWTLVMQRELSYEQAAQALELEQARFEYHMRRAYKVVRRAVVKAGYARRAGRRSAISAGEGTAR